MAAVRFAARRRLCGSLLQRTQTAVTSPAISEERRRLVPRLMHTKPSRADVMREIQQKKGELYDVISKADRKIMTSQSKTTWLTVALVEAFKEE